MFNDFIISSIKRLFSTLEKNFGDHGEIMIRLKQKLERIGSIPSAVSRKWEEILEKTQKVRKILKAVKQLQEINPDVIYNNEGLERILKNIVPAEHYDLFCLKQNVNPEEILENAESIIDINTIDIIFEF